MAFPENDQLFDTPKIDRFVEGLNPGSEGRSYTQRAPFVKMIVLDVIPDPVNMVNDAKINYWIGVYGVENTKYAKALPRNSIIAKPVGLDVNPLLVFPFFPSHLSLPCKAGEMVWTMVDNPGASFADIAYWMCKVTLPHYVDDVNHTHAPRTLEIDAFKGTEDTAKAKKSVFEMRNGGVLISEGSRYTDANTAYVIGRVYGKSATEDIFENLVTETDSAKMSQYEPVPRFTKRPGDIAIEGSNNALIVLGTDRVNKIAEYPNPKSPDIPMPSPPATDINGGNAGMIDIVVGRGQTPENFGKTAVTTKIMSPEKKLEIKKELDKDPETVAQFRTEGDPNFTHDRSRVLISQRTNVDTNFGIAAYNASSPINNPSDSPSGDAAIVIKSDKVRIIARSDIQLITTGYDTTQLNPEIGQQVKNQKSTQDDWASITLKSNGDIVFTPSKTGYIKLGDDTADKAILCTDIPATKNKGTVESGPVKSTGNSEIGTGKPGQGTFAKKILVK